MPQQLFGDMSGTVAEEGVMGGQPRIEGRRISVLQVVEWIHEEGMEPETVATEFDLGMADIHRALAYYCNPGSADRVVVECCRERGRVLLTNDDDSLSFDDHPGLRFLTEQQTPPRDVATTPRRIDRHVPDPADRM